MRRASVPPRSHSLRRRWRRGPSTCSATSPRASRRWRSPASGRCPTSRRRTTGSAATSSSTSGSRARRRPARRRHGLRRGLRLGRARRATPRSVVGVDANPEAHEHARLRYVRPNLRFERDLVDSVRRAVRRRRVPADDRARAEPRDVLDHFKRAARGRAATVAYVSTPNVLTLAPEGRRALRQPVARHGVPRGGVPRAVRGALRAGRAPRALPRAQAARCTSWAIEHARLGRRAPAPGHHRALLRPLHPGDRRRATSRCARPSRAPTSTGRSTSSPSAARERRGLSARPALPHALRRGLRDVAVRRGVAVGGDRHLLPAAPRRAGARRPAHAVASRRSSPTSSRRRASPSAA